MDDKQKKLTSLMRAKRREKNLTQEQAAELLDISVRWFQKVERGQAKPGFDLICDLAAEFSIDFSKLGEDDSKTG